MIVPFNDFRLLNFEIIHSIATVLSIVFNSTLLFLILTKTTGRLKTYAVILFASAIFDLMIAISAGLTMQRTVPIGYGLVLISHGPCRLFGGWQACIIAQSIDQHANSFTIILIPISFWYRHRVLYEQQPEAPKLILFLSILYIPVLISAIGFSIGSETQEMIEEMLRESNYTIYPSDHLLYAVHGFKNIFYSKATPQIFLLCIPCFPCCMIGLYYRSRIVRILGAKALSSKTKELQKKLVKALTIHTGITLILATISTLFFWEQLKFPFYHYIPYFEEMVFVCLQIVSLLNPLVTIYFVLPYRTALFIYYRLFLSFFGIRPKTVEGYIRPSTVSSSAATGNGQI